VEKKSLTSIETMKNSPDRSGMVAERVGADPCVCLKRRQATIRTDSRTRRNDGATNLALQKKKENKKKRKRAIRSDRKNNFSSTL